MFSRENSQILSNASSSRGILCRFFKLIRNPIDSLLRLFTDLDLVLDLFTDSECEEFLRPRPGTSFTCVLNLMKNFSSLFSTSEIGT